FRGLLARGLNRHEFSLSNSRAPPGGLVPLLPALHQLRPEWKNAALRGLDRVDGATVLTKKNTLSVLRGAQTAGIFCPVNKPVLEFLPGGGEKLRRAPDVVFGE